MSRAFWEYMLLAYGYELCPDADSDSFGDRLDSAWYKMTANEITLYNSLAFPDKAIDRSAFIVELMLKYPIKEGGDL